MKFPHIAAVLALIVAPLAPAFANDDEYEIDDMPFAIACTDGGVRNYAYLARIEADGTAIYITPTNIAITVPHDGAISAAGDTNIVGDCAGKTLHDLIESDQGLQIDD